MNRNIMINKKSSLIILYSLCLVVASLFFLSGCTDTIEGDVNENLRPIVTFVNIPPEGQQFSRNPEVYWIGNDPDGLIDYYRYHIALQTEVDAFATVDDYIATLNNNDWIQINIKHDESDPHTTNVIPLSADTLNPVTNPVGQYVLLQAFDRENLGSIVAKRLFNRNDNPPETTIPSNYQSSLPFVNSVLEGGVVTGIRLNWEGSDRRDYDELGLTPPPFDFEWRLFGPFSDSSLYDTILTNFVEKVVVTDEAQILHQGEEFSRCQSIQVDSINGTDTITVTIDSCIIIPLDSAFFANEPESPFYTIHEILNVDTSFIDTMLVTNSWNGVDEWIQNTRDTIYNVYTKDVPDTTIELNFIFWIRSRDDAFVKDLTPAFISFPVINPRYERDVAVIDFTPLNTYPNNGGMYKHKDTAKAYWFNTIHKWAADRRADASINDPDTIYFDTSVFTFAEVPDNSQAGKTGIDYIIASRYSSGIPIKYLLKHKVLILYNESNYNSGFVGNTVQFPEILSAMDAGINVWATWRNPLNVNPASPFFQIVAAPAQYLKYFGVISMTFSGWFGLAYFPDFNNFPIVPITERNEDFIGTYSLNESEWPSLDIDTGLLHSRLEWFDGPYSPLIHYEQPQLGWRDTIGALPEVNWAQRSAGTEAMYLYKSLYGADHEYAFEGAPVGHRLESNLFRTVHFNFTMLTVDSLQGQIITNDVMNWLYSRKLSVSTVSEDRYPNAPNYISIDEARKQYGQRLIEQAAIRSQSGE